MAWRTLPQVGKFYKGGTNDNYGAILNAAIEELRQAVIDVQVTGLIADPDHPGFFIPTA